ARTGPVTVVAGLTGRVLDRGDDVATVLGVDVVPLELKRAAGGEGAALARAAHDVEGRLLFLHPELGHRVPRACGLVLAGIVKDLILLGSGEVEDRGR